MTVWDEAARARDVFLEHLVRAGFDVHSDGPPTDGPTQGAASQEWADGSLDVPGLPRPIDIEIRIPADFPYVPPKVTVPDGHGTMSWHRERDFALCLYADTDAAEPPWVSAADFLDQVRAWFVADAAGWPNDPPDLDLERYWPRVGGLVLYDDFDDLVGRPLRAGGDRDGLYRLKVGPPIRKGARKRSWRLGALAVDVGVLVEPPHDWRELAAVLPDPRSVERQIQSGTVNFLLIRYQRGAHQGVLALWVESNNPITLNAVASAHEGGTTMRLRGGGDASVLGDLSVAVVGLGAVGGFVADGLARAGIGGLTLVDGDILRPGNLIRHVLDGTHVGKNKADALAAHLRQQPWSPGRVESRGALLTDVAETTELLRANDLVIDASAAGRVTKLVLDGAAGLGEAAISVCLQRSGGIVRVDRAPLLAGECWADPTPSLAPTGEELREGGCGDPVSPTPAWACSHAASLAVAVAVDHLTGRLQYGASTVTVLVAQPDVPYRSVGTVR